MIYSKDHFCCPCLVYLKIKAFQFMLSALKRQNFCIVNLFADLWINLFHLRYPLMVIPSISRQSFTLYIEIQLSRLTHLWIVKISVTSPFRISPLAMCHGIHFILESGYPYFALKQNGSNHAFKNHILLKIVLFHFCGVTKSVEQSQLSSALVCRR